MNLSHHYLSKAPARQREVFTLIQVLLVIGLASLSSPRALGVKGAVPAQSEWMVRTWETSDGLPDNSVTAIAQTPDGYIWLGTFNGLVRFNGVEFKVFNPDNTPQLPSGGIVNMHVDKAGQLLVSTYGGVVLLEGAEWRNLTQTNRPSAAIVRTFVERDNGDVLMTLFNGTVLEFSKGAVSPLPTPPGENGEGYFGGADEGGHWWVVQNQFIGRWDNGKWTQMISPPGVQRDAVCCSPARDGGMWVLLGADLRKLRRGVEVWRKTLPEPISGAWRMFEDSRSTVWIATQEKGFYRVTPEGAIDRYGASDGWSDKGRCVFEDQEGNLWVGTNGEGLLRATPRRFRYFDLLPASNGAAVESIYADNDVGIWAATYGKGLFHLSSSGGTNFAPFEVAGIAPWAQSVLADHAGRLWVGSFGARLQVLDKSGAHDIAPPELRSDNAVELFEDSRGHVWFSRGEDFVAEYDGNGFQKFGGAGGLFKGSVVGFAEEASGALWVASSGGVYRRIGEQPFVEVKASSGSSIDGIVGFEPDRDGSMWLMSEHRGLLRWKNGELAHVGVNQGLPLSSLRGIVDDEAGYFWITSGSKVVRVLHNDLCAVADGRMSRVDCQIFDGNDGLPRAEFTSGRQPNCARDAQGRLWFATTKGVVAIEPGKLRLNNVPPAVHIEEISYYRSGLLETNVVTGRPVVREHQERITSPFQGQVRLPPGSHRIEIRYACLSFAAPEKVRTEVRIGGLEPSWHPAEGRVEQIHDLRPGSYMFQVRGANNDGIWNEAGEGLALTMTPYYWQTIAFRVGVGVLLVSLGAAGAWGWSRSRIRRAAEREHAARELADAQQRMDLAAEAANVGMWMWDLAPDRIWATAKFRELFGFTDSEEISLDKIQKRIHPQDRRQRQETLQRAMKTAGSYELEYRVVRADGVERWIASKSRADSDNAGRPVRVVGVCIDITERRRTQVEMQNLRQELAHSGRVTMMGQLASALAHELSQPLGAILRNAEAAELFLQGSNPDLEELRSIVSDIRRDDQRAGAVIERLRSLLKRGGIETQSLDAGKLADEIVPLLRPDAQGRRVSIELEKRPNLPLVRGDRVQLQQVLLNLVVNGMDAVANCEPDRRRVRVQVEPDGEWFVSVAVSDSGQGIPAAQLGRVFEPFFTTKAQGMGIGLSISRTIVEAHGGRISAMNNPDGGATFRFTVPVANGEGVQKAVNGRNGGQ